LLLLLVLSAAVPAGEGGGVDGESVLVGLGGRKERKGTRRAVQVEEEQEDRDNGRLAAVRRRERE